jgi:hypothetical protein
MICANVDVNNEPLFYNVQKRDLFEAVPDGFFLLINHNYYVELHKEHSINLSPVAVLPFDSE